MSLRLSYTRHTLNFKFDARTSRGAISDHTVYYLKVWDSDVPHMFGVGECAPLAGLSIDYRPDLEDKLKDLVKYFATTYIALQPFAVTTELPDLTNWPAIAFALETALLNMKQGGGWRIFENAFSHGKSGIPINGLIWMGDKAFMQQQIEKKLAEGYSCLKLKIGSLDFTTELDILQGIREVAPAQTLTVRVDANGAFSPQEAYKKLERLAKYELHSIEQPIKAGQIEQMAELCAYTPIPIALDEELIGVPSANARKELIQSINPQFIILKPTLLGGLGVSAAWIELAEANGAGWWITSALESNIGLNAISQFTAQYNTALPQGLGTGQLYHNNIASPLKIEQGELWFKE